ncbi:MAG: ABC transporter permease, partial [Euryarchaeota archaeon]|nr:ABC transporter permease [Euryarchaeota archaeon]
MEYLIEGILRAVKLLVALDPYVISVAKVQIMVSTSAVLLASATAVPLAVL